MATESKAGAESGLPFEDPLQVPRDQTETIKMASDDSAEYAEVFGDHGVPCVRSFTSASGMSMLNFVRIAALEKNFASSDRSKGNDSLIRSSLAGGVGMAIDVAPAPECVAVSPVWVGNKPPADYEKLWRGLALVGAAHLAGMLVNVVSQMLGIHSLDRIPAMFLGL